MNIIIFFAVLVILILVHEFGHFFVAKKSGIRVDEFGIGLPPKIYGKKIGETEYTINWLPIGGFVRIWGENPTDEDYTDDPSNEQSFVNKPRHIQAAVLVAGVTMNILFAFVLYVAAYMIGMPTAVYEGDNLTDFDNVRLLITSVIPDTPATDILKSSDEILSLSTESSTLLTKSTLTAEEVSKFISTSNGDDVTFDVLRRGKPESVTVKPQQGVISSEPEKFATGFSMTQVGIKQLPVHMAIYEGAIRTYYSLKDITIGLAGLVSGMFKGTSDFSQITGPVGIVGLVGDAAALGFTWLLTFAAFISLNLAVINLLPFPALDGGRLIFVGIESITRKPIKPIIATRLNQFGMIALLTLMVVVTVNDILKFF